jgi:hypothetical protein
MRNKGKTVNLKIIEQDGLPPVNRPAYVLSSQKLQTQQPQDGPGQGRDEQNDDNNNTSFPL